MKKITKIVSGIVTGVMLFCVEGSAAANDTVQADIVDFNVFINGERQDIKNSILLINDFTYLPVRETAQALGLGVIWKEYDKTIKVTDKGINYAPKTESAVYGASTVTADVTDFLIQVNDDIVETENKVVAVDGVSYLPLRDIAEAFSMEVDWNQKTQTVSISKKEDKAETAKTAENTENGYLLPFNVHSGLEGYMDKDGNVIAEPQYTSASQFHEGMAQVARNGAVYNFEASGDYGYINAEGVEVVPCAYDNAYAFSGGLGLVWKEIGGESAEFIYFDKQGNVVLDFEGLDAESFFGGYASVEIDSKTYGFIDKNGNFMTELPDDAPEGAGIWRRDGESEFTDGIKAEEISENNYRISDDKGRVLSTVYSVRTPRIISKDAVMIAPAEDENWFAERQYIKSSGEEIKVKTNYTNDSVMNSGIPVYKYGDTLYYSEQENVEDNFWRLKAKTGDKTEEIAQAWAITSVFVNNDFVYFNAWKSGDEDHNYYVDINRYDKQSGETLTLFSAECDMLPQWDDFIYEENGAVYYFVPFEGLWKYENGESGLILERAEGCVIKDEYIYYSNEDGIFETDAYGMPPRKLASQEELLAQDERLKIAIGDAGYVQNLALRNNELYFMFTPLLYRQGPMFKIELSSRRLTFLDGIVPNRFAFDGKSLLFCGYNSGKKGMYSLERDGSVKTVPLRVGTNGFYLKDGTIYYYTQETADGYEEDDNLMVPSVYSLTEYSIEEQ